MHRESLLRTCATLLALFVIAPLMAAQTVYASSGPAASVIEITGPPAGACLYPAGPGVSAFPTAVPFVCPLPGPVAPGMLSGDVAVNHVTNTVWVTDGLVLGEFTPTGVPLKGFGLPPGAILPGPLTGMGFGGGILWITDGAFIAGITPPPVPGCFALPAIAVAPWPVPPAVGMLTDVDFAPSTGTLWGCSAGGAVANLIIGGGLIALFPAGACPMPLPLTGIAYDHATPTFAGGPPCLYVSNGTAISYITPPAGGPGPLKFYVTAPCFPNLAGPFSTGLSSSLHPIAYGVGFSPVGPLIPVMGALAQSTTPSPGFAFTLTSAAAAPGTVAALFVDFGALCPPIPFKGNPLYCLPTIILGPFPVAGGALVLPAPLPPALPIGPAVFAQWVIKIGGSPLYQVSNGMEFTIGMP